MPLRFCHYIARNVFAKENHVRLENASTGRTSGDDERSEVRAFQISVAIWCIGRIDRQPIRIQTAELLLKLIARDSQPASQAAHQIKSPMQVDHLPAAG